MDSKTERSCAVLPNHGLGYRYWIKKNAEQIFEVFKRLQSRDVYPGSGIGLALCRRIIANHQGALLAESEPGKGTRFRIILPDRQEFKTVNTMASGV